MTTRYTVQRESWFGQWSKSSISRARLRTLGAPRAKMWMTRETARGERVVFVERRLPGWDGLDITDLVVSGDVPRPTGKGTYFRVSVDGRERNFWTWEGARTYMINRLG